MSDIERQSNTDKLNLMEDVNYAGGNIYNLQFIETCLDHITDN